MFACYDRIVLLYDVCMIWQDCVTCDVRMIWQDRVIVICDVCMIWQVCVICDVRMI